MSSRGGDCRVGVRVEGLVKEFGTVRAVDSVDLSIGAGQFFSLLGPSGCGKTTLLRLLAGLETPTAGRIWVDGLDVTDLLPERRPTNMVFQSYALFPHLDVRGNIGYGLRAERLARRELQTRVDEVLALVRLQGFDGRRPNELSGGQRQRVALARALVKRPKVLLLDEPMAALDQRLRETVQQELRELQHRVGITFVLVTHDQDEAFALSDSIAVMAGGRVLQVARPAELYARPNGREVASFVGAVNLLAGRVDWIDATTVKVAAGPLGEFVVARSGIRMNVGDSVTLALRPERVKLGIDPEPRPPGALQARVVSADYLGDRTYVRVAVDDSTAPLLACISAAPNADQFPTGRAVWVDLSTEHVVIVA